MLVAPAFVTEQVAFFVAIFHIIFVFILATGVLQHHLWLILPVGPADLRQHTIMNALNRLSIVIVLYSLLWGDLILMSSWF